jgi:PEP-CTERM motif
MKTLSSLAFFALAIVAFNGNILNASSVGTDNASLEPPYETWDNGDDGAATGNGFLPWSLSVVTTGTASFAGHFIGDSTTLAPGNSGANINVGGESFLMFGNGGQPVNADAFRPFDGDLAVGQTFSMDLAVNFRNGFKGMDLQTSAAATIFNFNIGGDDYVVSQAATGNGSIGSTYDANTEFNLSFTQTSLAGGTWTITRSGGVADSDSGTYTGVAGQVHLYIGNAEGGDENNLFANNLSIVPEPSTIALALIGTIGLMGLRRRR